MKILIACLAIAGTFTGCQSPRAKHSPLKTTGSDNVVEIARQRFQILAG